jgi:hypothetical protein
VISQLKRRMAYGAALAVFCSGLVVAAPAAHADPACVGQAQVHLLQAVTAKVVSVELAEPVFPNMLRARSDTVGAWEKFVLCYINDAHVFTLWSIAAQRYVAAEEAYPAPYTNMLRARTPAGQVGAWEKFVMYNLGGDTQWFTGSQGYLVTGDLGMLGTDKGMLLANRKTLGSWEHWVVHRDA